MSPAEECAFVIPAGRVVRVNAVEIAFSEAAHPFEQDNRAAIDANWQAEQTRNPALFDGQVLMPSRLVLEPDGTLHGTCHGVRFATFMLWRQSRPSGASHIFAHAMPVLSDGSLLAVRMGSHTANPGRVYFAAGSFDRSDIAGGRVDVGGNMRREVLEETGFDLAQASAEADLWLWSDGAVSVLFRRFMTGLAPQEALKSISQHIASDPEPEIEGAVVLAPNEPLPAGLMSHMEHLIAWHHATGWNATVSG